MLNLDALLHGLSRLQLGVIMLTEYERILLIVSERIGDVIFCTPAIKLLREQKPHATIDVLALSDNSKGILINNPAINNIWVNPKRGQIQQLVTGHDCVLDFHNSKLTQKYVKQLGLPTFTSPRSGEAHQSEVATQFVKQLLPALPGDHYIAENYCLFPQAEHYEKAKQLLLDNGASLDGSEILIGCHVGCHKAMQRAQKFWKRQIVSHKMWPLPYFLDLNRMLVRDNPKIRLILTGSPSERVLAENLITHSTNTIDLMGLTSVLDLVALMDYFSVFVTADTGPLHLASATSVPIVTMFGSTHPRYTGPRPLKDTTLVLHESSMDKVYPQTVYRAVLSLIKPQFVERQVASEVTAAE